MGFLGLRKKKAEAAPQDVPSTSAAITKVDPWQGNLPCCHGPTDGCDNHNPGRIPIHFDASLLSSPKPSGSAKDPNAPTEYEIKEVWSPLPRNAEYLAVLPPVHKSVPYSLAFYQVHAVMDRKPGSVPLLSNLYCSAMTGSRPPLSWVVTPMIGSDNTLLIEYALAFTVEADLGSWNEGVQHGRAIAKNWLIGSGFRNFELCTHMRRAFKSHKGEGKHGVRSAGVEFSLKREGGKEATEEWSSLADQTAEPAFCTRCYTDSYLRFSLVGNVVVCSVQIYKDLGVGLHPADPKWMSVARGIEVKRDPGDFGRMRREYEEMAVQSEFGKQNKEREEAMVGA